MELRILVLVASSVFAAAAAACGGGPPFASVTGNVPQWGSRSEVPVTICESGHHHGFFGVDVYDEHQEPLLRFIKDPGGHDRFFVPRGTNGGLVELDRSACSTLEGTAEEGRGSMNHVREIQGTLAVSCTLDGEPFRATMRFARCY